MNFSCGDELICLKTHLTDDSFMKKKFNFVFSFEKILLFSIFFSLF